MPPSGAHACPAPARGNPTLDEAEVPGTRAPPAPPTTRPSAPPPPPPSRPPPEEPHRPLAPGTWIRDKYRLDRMLGIGGMAAVYEATHRNGKRFALKLLHRHL